MVTYWLCTNNLNLVRCSIYIPFKLHKRIYVAACFFLILTSSHVSADCLRITADVGIKRFPTAPVRLIELFSNNGLCAEIEFIPGKRAVQLLKSGQTDGDMGRTEFFQRSAGSSVIAVPTPMFTTEIMFVSRSSQTKNYKEFQGQVGLIRGWALTKVFGKHYHKENVIAVDTLSNLKELYLSKRIDAVLLPIRVVYLLGLQSETTVVTAERFDNFLWLSRKHKHLVNRVDNIFKAYLENGGVFLDPPQNEIRQNM